MVPHALFLCSAGPTSWNSPGKLPPPSPSTLLLRGGDLFHVCVECTSHRLNPRPEYSFDDVAANIRQRAAIVTNEQQLAQLLTQIVKGLEVRPPAPVEVPLSSVAAAAASSGAPVSSAQIADLIQQLKSGSISQTQLYSQLTGSGSARALPEVTAIPTPVGGGNTTQSSFSASSISTVSPLAASNPGNTSLWTAFSTPVTSAAASSASLTSSFPTYVQLILSGVT
jgi:hypothetical protein